MPVLAGCETDSYLFDPSVLGRWEHTPTTVPILPRIASIEGPADEWVEYTDPSPADLIPELAEYRIGPGDRLQVVVYDLPDEGKAVPYDKIVDTRGYIDLPELGQINLNGLTPTGAAAAIQERMKELVTTRPLATVDVLAPRQQRISILGSVQTPSQYTVPVADYRLLEALTAAGGFSEAPDYVYIIRQTPLTSAGQPAGATGAQPETPTTPPSGERLIDIIDQMSQPERRPEPTPEGAPKPPGGSPGVLRPVQPATQPGNPPLIDLPDSTKPVAKPQPAAQAPADAGDVTWVHLDGKWVRVARPASQGVAQEGAAAPAGGARATALVTQRVIRIPVNRLISGDARVNIVIRPGDIIRVPPPPSGNVFVGGQVNRGGVFAMSQGITLQRMIIAAGGLSSIAVPERVDLVRMVGPERQATIRLNLRAIAEGTHPDIFLKPNDQINVGSNFWAVPLAVIRNGFRASYGFGLLIDRNFGNDIFGPPPEDNGFDF